MDFISTANSLLRRATKGIVDLPYSRKEINAIEHAGETAAFDMIGLALRNRIAELGLHCPMERIQKGYLNGIRLATGNLRQSGNALDNDVQIVLRHLPSSITMLASHAKEFDIPGIQDPDIVRFEILYANVSRGLRRSDPQKFMDFFQALGINDFRQLGSVTDANRCKPDDINWVGHAMGPYFRDAACGYIRSQSGAELVGPTSGFLNAIGVNRNAFTHAVANARLDRAKHFGPVRESRRQSLLSDLRA